MAVSSVRARRGYTSLLGVLTLAVVAASPAPPASAAIVRATYLFNGNLAAEEAGAPALVNVNPLGLNQFQAATVFGQARNVFLFNGNASPPTQQAGLQLNTAGLGLPSNNYSVELVFQFLENADSYRRILDTSNRTSDNGFYVGSSNTLEVFPDDVGDTLFQNNVFNYVVLTVEPGAGADSTVRAYLNGALQFTTTTSVVNNPNNLLSFFLDNTVAPFTDEYSDGRVALLRVSEGALTPAEVAALAADPFAVVPEPGSLTLLGLGGVSLALCRWRRRRQAT